MLKEKLKEEEEQFKMEIVLRFLLIGLKSN